jgi:hypothetical protein
MELNCLCVACGTQCEICLERYPADCTCLSDQDDDGE